MIPLAPRENASGGTPKATAETAVLPKTFSLRRFATVMDVIDPCSAARFILPYVGEVFG